MADNSDSDSVENERLSESFELATNFVRNVVGKLKSEDLLYLYARFKQAKEGKCTTSKPSFFDFQGKHKWEAWKKLEDMPTLTAKVEYIEYLSKIMPGWQHQEVRDIKGGGDTGLGITVSRMVCSDDEIDDCDKTVFDWCKDGNVDKVKKCLDENNFNVDNLDEEGMSLLHWACDRGLYDMVELLLQYNADKNLLDSDGQSPLHYAVDCQHKKVVELLLDHQVNVYIEDNDGIKPVDIQTSISITTLLQSHSGL